GAMSNPFGTQEAADRYDLARSLPADTISLWMDTLRSHVPRGEVRRILDLGCGTGRFTGSLGRMFACPVVGVEPSTSMLETALSRQEEGVEWRQGHAEEIPLGDAVVDLVFMSQVFHHLGEPRRALQEIARVLTPAGYLAIRNATRESNR